MHTRALGRQPPPEGRLPVMILARFPTENHLGPVDEILVIEAGDVERKLVTLQVPVIVGHMMLKSASMARFINSNLPGITVPENLIRELEGLPRSQLVEKSLQISVTLLKKMKPLCQGIHFIPAGWETCVPGIVQELRPPKSSL